MDLELYPSQLLFVMKLSDYLLPEFAVYAVYPDQQHLPRRIRLFIDYLAQNFGDNPYWDK